MKNKLKGFTLVELVVVMALMSILMVAIMNMFKPIRDTYVDSTQYEAQRTVQNGIVQYITESVRFATDMGIYTSDKVSNVSTAVEKFADEYITKNSLTGDDATRAKEAIQRSAEVMVIDNSDHEYGGKDWYGRILRRKFKATTSGISNAAYPYKTEKITNDAEDVSKTDYCRMALGAAYYGENNYSISLDITDKAKGMLGVSVASTRNNKKDISNKGKETTMTGTVGGTSSGQVTRGSILCRNLAGASDKGVATAGIYDARNTVLGDTDSLCSVTKTTITTVTPNKNIYTVDSTTKGQKTYIVFINNKIDYTTKTT